MNYYDVDGEEITLGEWVGLSLQKYTNMYGFIGHDIVAHGEYIIETWWHGFDPFYRVRNYGIPKVFRTCVTTVETGGELYEHSSSKDEAEGVHAKMVKYYSQRGTRVVEIENDRKCCKSSVGQPHVEDCCGYRE